MANNIQSNNIDLDRKSSADGTDTASLLNAATCSMSLLNSGVLQTAFNAEDFLGLSRRKIWRLISIFLSEFFATAVLLFLLCSVIQAVLFKGKSDHLTVGVAAGFAVGTSVMIFGHISGSHINPALSVAAVLLSEISLPMCLFYIVAQCAGATFGYSLTRAILPNVVPAFTNETYLSYCCSGPTPELQDSPSQVLLVELAGTAILCWAFCSALDKRNLNKHDSLPLKFGIVIIALALPLAYYSGCSINPARSFGPALYNQHWKMHWVYWIGPIIGSSLTAIIYRCVFDPAYAEVATNDTRRDPATINLRKNSHKCEEEP